MNTKFIFITGGVISSLGKGVTSSTIACLLKARGFKVFNQKCDPYLNVNPSNMSPLQHGEVFVTDDGAETDLDLGHYERFSDTNLNRTSSVTAGRIYSNIIENQKADKYEGKTVQFIPHVTNEIKKYFLDAAESSKADFVITEIGGTIGDLESLAFVEAIRQFKYELGASNVMNIHVTLVPHLESNGEIKTKPTQQSVAVLRNYGISPDMLVLRSAQEIPAIEKEKVSMYCGVPLDRVVVAKNEGIIYQIIQNFKSQNVEESICKYFNIKPKQPCDLSLYDELAKRIETINGEINIALIGKYVALPDAYLSCMEALKHAGYKEGVKVNITLIRSNDINESNVKILLKKCSGIVIPGTYGETGHDGVIEAIKYARMNNIPYFGICLGMEMMCVEFAESVLGIQDANSVAEDKDTLNPIIKLITDSPEHLRLGLRKIKLVDKTLVKSIYGKDIIEERHRHIYGFNIDYKEKFVEKGFVFAGQEPDTGIEEIVELKGHPFFLGVQFQPEFISRPFRPHPLFQRFIKEAKKLNYK